MAAGVRHRRCGVSLAALVLVLVLAGPAQADSGTWERAWGKNVNGGGVFGVCTSAPSCQAGTEGPLGGELSFPESVATDSLGNVYVAGSLSHPRIQKFNSAGTWERAWGRNVNGGGVFEICTVAANCLAGDPGSLGGEMRLPWSVGTDSLGNVYVTDTQIARAQKFNSSGTWERTWGRNVNMTNPGDLCTAASGDTCQSALSGGVGGAMNGPLGIAGDSSGNVYIADAGQDRVQKFNSSGIWERAWGRDVVLSGEHETASDGFEICVNPAGSDPDDVCKTGLNGGGAGGDMSAIHGIATDSSGNVYVVDPGLHRVQKYDSLGNWQRAWGRNVNGGGGFGVCTVIASCLAGTTGTLGGEMSSPSGVATDSLGNVYVADTFNNRIQEFDPSGNFRRAWGRGVNGGTVWGICTVAASCQFGLGSGLGNGCELSQPYGVATDPSGNVYVADSNHYRIQKFVQDPLVPPATEFNCGASSQPPPPPPPPPPTPPVTPTVPLATPPATGTQPAAKKKCKQGRKREGGKCVKKKKKKVEPTFTG